MHLMLREILSKLVGVTINARDSIQECDSKRTPKSPMIVYLGLKTAGENVAVSW